MANCMAEVAKALGVELEEVFRIDDYDYEIHGYYKITKEGLYISRNKNPYNWGSAFSQNLNLLLKGEIELTKLPQKPAIGDLYCFPCPASPMLYSGCMWEDDEVDNYRFQCGFVFTSEEEAIAMAEEMINGLPKKG